MTGQKKNAIFGKYGTVPPSKALVDCGSSENFITPQLVKSATLMSILHQVRFQ